MILRDYLAHGTIWPVVKSTSHRKIPERGRAVITRQVSAG
jgi:hypothetical protein